ncbi:MAG: hypothetical protein ACJ8DC_11315 [Gemmatimonadales bacterium]
MRTITLPALVLLLTQVPALGAQEACKEVLKLPAVGKWVEYQALYDQKDKYALRYAVVGEEKREGTDYRWLEMRMTNQTDPGKNLVYQMLVPGSLAAIGDVQEVVMKAGERPAMKMNGMMMGMVRGQLQKKSVFGDICDEVTLVGQEKVTVPAGTFEAKHYHSEKYGNDSWVDPGLSFGMVKAIGKHHDIQRVSDGDGAKSSITETPQEMPGMGEKKEKQ